MESEYLKSNKFRNHLPKNWYIKVSPGNKPTSVYDWTVKRGFNEVGWGNQSGFISHHGLFGTDLMTNHFAEITLNQFERLVIKKPTFRLWNLKLDI
mgnify:FL=1